MSGPRPKLFEPLTVRGVTLRNRVGVSPMCQYGAIEGVPQPWHLPHLGARAMGGAGLVIAEATGVSPEGRITPGCTGLWDERQLEAWRPIAAFIKQQGSVAGIQIAHAGRKASAALPWDGGAHLDAAHGGWETLAPSNLAFGGGLTKVPKAMTFEDIARLKAAFRATTERALRAGFEWLEIHSAHGYLMHEFLSPLSNQRQDEYGGSFDKRVRLLLETVAEVRTVWPERLPLAVRLSCTDWEEGGWDLEQSIEVSRRLKKAGVDLIDCSSGGMTPTAKVPVAPGFQVPFAQAIREQAGIATAAVGLITEPAQAEAIVANGQADLVLLARAFLRDPYWPIHAAETLGAQDACPYPVPYGRA